ncbi:MAG: hypothetical protein WHT63_11995, partial [Tepidiforma sp.]
VAIGAYARGADPLVDRALELLPAINAFLRQRADECPPFDEALAALFAIDPEFAVPADAPADPAFRDIDPEEVTGEPVVEAAEAPDPAA